MGIPLILLEKLELYWLLENLFLLKESLKELNEPVLEDKVLPVFMFPNELDSLVWEEDLLELLFLMTSVFKLKGLVVP